MISLPQLAWLALLLTSFASAYADQKMIMWDRSAGGVLDRGVQISLRDFTPERLIFTCQEFLRDSQSTVIHLTLVPSGQSLAFFQPSDHTYSGWLRNYKRSLEVSVRIAELVSIRGNAVLRVRDGLSIWRHILVGRDPLIYDIAGDTFEVLHLTLSAAIVYPLRIFARCSGELSVSKAEKFLAELQKLVPSEVDIRIRKDHWFFDCLAFPEAYWYDLTEPPSSAAAVLSAPDVHCSTGTLFGQQTRCAFYRIE